MLHCAGRMRFIKTGLILWPCRHRMLSSMGGGSLRTVWASAVFVIAWIRRKRKVPVMELPRAAALIQAWDAEFDASEAEVPVCGPANCAATVRHDYEPVGIGHGQVLIAKLCEYPMGF